MPIFQLAASPDFRSSHISDLDELIGGNVLPPYGAWIMRNGKIGIVSAREGHLLWMKRFVETYGPEDFLNPNDEFKVGLFDDYFQRMGWVRIVFNGNVINWQYQDQVWAEPSREQFASLSKLERHFSARLVRT